MDLERNSEYFRTRARAMFRKGEILAGEDLMRSADEIDLLRKRLAGTVYEFDCGKMTDKAQIREIEMSGGTLTIRWAKLNIGFGEYEIGVQDGKLVGLSECMDRGDDKSFLKELLDAIADEVEVIG